MSEERPTAVEFQIIFLLRDLGLKRTSTCFRYLQFSLPLVLEGLRPGPDLWSLAAAHFGKRPANVRNAIRSEITRAYRRCPLAFADLVEEVLFEPPSTADFFALLIAWLQTHEMVDLYDGDRYLSTEARPRDNESAH